MKTIQSLIITAMIFCTNFSYATQDYDKITLAFTKSYELEAAGDYTKAISAVKDVYSDQSYEINLRLGWLNYAAGLFTESMAYYQKAMAIMPLSIEPKFGYIFPASALGNWDAVKKQYEDVLIVDPRNTKANYKLGLIFYGRKEYQKAQKHFTAVINLYPFDYDSLLMLGWTDYFLGQTKEARILFSKVLLYAPNDASALEGLSYIK